MVLEDLRDFIPQGYFDREAEKFKFNDGIKNSGHYSRELRWGYLAGKLGKRLFFRKAVLGFLHKPHCLVKLKSGRPGHPLYKRADLKPIPL